MQTKEQIIQLHQFNLKLKKLTRSSPLSFFRLDPNLTKKYLLLWVLPVLATASSYQATTNFEQKAFHINYVSDGSDCIRNAYFGRDGYEEQDTLDEAMEYCIANHNLVVTNQNEFVTYLKPRLSTLYWPMMFLALGVYYSLVRHFLSYIVSGQGKEDNLGELAKILTEYNKIFTILRAQSELTDLDKRLLFKSMPKITLNFPENHEDYAKFEYAFEEYSTQREKLTSEVSLPSKSS